MLTSITYDVYYLIGNKSFSVCPLCVDLFVRPGRLFEEAASCSSRDTLSLHLATPPYHCCECDISELSTFRPITLKWHMVTNFVVDFDRLVLCKAPLDKFLGVRGVI